MKQHTKRYFSSEDKILNAVNEELVRTGGMETISIAAIAHRAKLSRNGVYYHYPNVEAIYQENVNIIIGIVCEIVEKARVRKDDKRTFLRYFLIGASRNALLFEIEQNRGSHLIWTKILPEIRDLLTQGWTSYGKTTDERIFRRFSYNFVGTIYEWGESGYDKKEIERYLRQLVRLTKIAVQRGRELSSYIRVQLEGDGNS